MKITNNTTLEIETKHHLAAELLFKAGHDVMKATAIAEVSNANDSSMPHVMEFRVSASNDINYSNYIYAFIHPAPDNYEISCVEFIDASAIDHAVKELVRRLAIIDLPNTAGCKTEKEFALQWLSDYDLSDITAFDN